MKQPVSHTPKRSWPQVYKSFLLSSDEHLFLKIAPLAILLGSPEIIASNLIPIVGEFVDVGGLSLSAASCV